MLQVNDNTTTAESLAKATVTINAFLVGIIILGAKGSELINILLFVVELHHSKRNKNVFIIYHSGVGMLHSLTSARIGAHQCAIT
mmetsp:Transcript_29363/g.51011  ORF Transcript_29363/g.51011 Transcript_29363/m.51011 type:complete len:85 (+) Transcript_29363:90-344(+)